MKKFNIVQILTISFLATGLWSGNVNAHHSFFAEFSSQMGEVEGEVVEIFYQNPHAHYYIKTINADGEEEIWDAHGQNIRRMLRFGWKRNTLKLGDKVKIMGNLGLNETKKNSYHAGRKRKWYQVEPDRRQRK